MESYFQNCSALAYILYKSAVKRLLIFTWELNYVNPEQFWKAQFKHHFN